MLDTIANFYEDEVDREVDALISTLEPLLMVFIGGIVGFILIALYLPIFKMGELIKWRVMCDEWWVEIGLRHIKNII